MKTQLNRRRFVKHASLTSVAVIAASQELQAALSSVPKPTHSHVIGPHDTLNQCMLQDGLCNPGISIRPHQLLSLVCISGGNDCPLIASNKARHILRQLKMDPSVAIRLESHADRIPRFDKLDAHTLSRPDAKDVFNRKRDLDVLQRLGLVPGDTRRARYLFELLFKRVESAGSICAYDTDNWKGCELASTGAYERARAKGWQSIVWLRSDEEKQMYRLRNVKEIKSRDRLYIRPHHLMCLCCMYNGGKGLQTPNSNNTLYEILQRIQSEPDVPITLVEGTGMACESCDGYYPPSGRCVHAGGLIRDYKKDLGVFQKLGLMPGATMKARACFELLFARIPTTRDICAFGDGIVRSQEWAICGGPDGSAGYANTRLTGVFSQ